MKKTFSFIIFVSTATFLLVGCYKEPTFDFAPKIDFSNIQKKVILEAFSGAKTDSIIVSIKFQDGDGDLGLSETEKAKNPTNFNYLVKILEKKNGIYTEKVQTEPYSGIFPRLKETDKSGPLEGTLNYSMNFQQTFIPKGDTVKFQISIKDRAGNISNSIETTPVILHEF